MNGMTRAQRRDLTLKIIGLQAAGRLARSNTHPGESYANFCVSGTVICPGQASDRKPWEEPIRYTDEPSVGVDEDGGDDLADDALDAEDEDGLDDEEEDEIDDDLDEDEEDDDWDEDEEDEDDDWDEESDDLDAGVRDILSTYDPLHDLTDGHVPTQV